MKSICTIKVGNIKINFHCLNNYWIDFLRKQYSAHLSPAKSSYNVHIESNFKPLKYKSLNVGYIGKDLIIKRADFYSTTNYNLKRTYLNVDKNKYSFDSWLRVFFTLLSLKYKGLLLHGAGFYLNGHLNKDNNGVYLLLGKSGSGKSSITRILGKKHSLSDELIHVFFNKGKLMASSTPFWGELAKGLGNIYTGQVRKIYYLKHGKNYKISDFSKGESVKNLLKSVLYFNDNVDNINKVLSLSLRAVSAVPSYQLTFALNAKKNELVKIFTNKHSKIG